MDDLNITLSLIERLSELTPESLEEWNEKALEIMAGKAEGQRYVETVTQLVKMGGRVYGS